MNSKRSYSWIFICSKVKCSPCISILEDNYSKSSYWSGKVSAKHKGKRSSSVAIQDADHRIPHHSLRRISNRYRGLPPSHAFASTTGQLIWSLEEFHLVVTILVIIRWVHSVGACEGAAIPAESPKNHCDPQRLWMFPSALWHVANYVDQ